MTINVFYNWYRNFPLAHALGYAVEMLWRKKKLILFMSVVLVSCMSENTRSIDTDDSVANEKFDSTKSQSSIYYNRESVILNSYDKQNLIDQALFGNDSAYEEISANMILNHQGDELFYTSFIMANRLNNSKAMRDIYLILADRNRTRFGDKLEPIDSTTRNIALYYLLKSYECGNRNSIFPIQDLFLDTNHLPRSIDFLRNIIEHDLKEQKN